MLFADGSISASRASRWVSFSPATTWTSDWPLGIRAL